MPRLHNKARISTIYIFCGNKARHEQWTQEWSKIKGVFTHVEFICEALKKAVQEFDQNNISMSFMVTNNNTTIKNLDHLDQSFMYTQILKEILLTIDFESQHITEFIIYCREQFDGNTTELENIEIFEKQYHQRTPIWWYTYQPFLYSMLNRTLRTMEVDLIIKLGFFIRDLHEHISQLHSQIESIPFIVYRGQDLSQIGFDKLMKTKGGLLSFNSFLSTSKNPSVSLSFARATIENSGSL